MTSAHVINQSRVLTPQLQSHVLIFRANCDRDRSTVSERFSVGEISHLSKISSMPLCKACPGCGGMVNVRKVSCSCGMCL